jgi:hypothetical protein
MTELPAFEFSTIHDAALQLREAARANRVEVHPVPYLRFDPEGDWTWWLSPFPDNPAYAHGKVVIEKPSIISDDQPLIGFHVEKGVGPSAAPAFEATQRDRRLVMANNWTWHAFLRGMRTGDVDASLAQATEAAADMPLRIAVIAGPQAPGRLDPNDQPRGLDPERVWFEIEGGRLRRRGDERVEVLRALGHNETFATLAAALDAVPPRDLDWRWIEILAGIPFRRDTLGALSASEVWRQACAPWLRWVR